jgi:hypothetical protein
MLTASSGGVSPNVLKLGERDILTTDITAQDGLIGVSANSTKCTTATRLTLCRPCI